MPAPYGTPTYWSYDDIYQAVITSLLRSLDQREYILNFSVIALHTHQPRAIVRFTLQSLLTNRHIQWELLLNAAYMPQLINQIVLAITLRKDVLENE